MTDDFTIQQTLETETRAASAPVSDGYESLDVDSTKETYDELNAALDTLTTTAVQTLDQMVPYLAKMQSLLSQRGSGRKKILKKAGLPAWTKWVKAFAAKLDRSLRTVQDRIRQFHAGRESGSPSGSTRTGNRERVKLDARQQGALVKAQLATSDLVAALEKGGDWESALAEYKKVAVSPEKLDGFLSAFTSEPDWKRAFTQLVGALAQCGGELPASVRTALNAAKRLLGEKTHTERLDAGNQSKAKAECRDVKVEKTAKDLADGRVEYQTTTASPKRHPIRSLTVDGRTIKKGFTCKYNGIDCEIAEVFEDGTVLLQRTCDGVAIAGSPVPMGELRSVVEKPKAASKRGKSHERKPDCQAVASEGLSAGLASVSPGIGPEVSGGEVSEATTGPGSRQGDFTRSDVGKWEYDPLPQRHEQSAGV